MSELFKKASALCMVQLFPVTEMTEGCWHATNSGGRKKYVIGYLDNGNVFVEEFGE